MMPGSRELSAAIAQPEKAPAPLLAAAHQLDCAETGDGVSDRQEPLPLFEFYYEFSGTYSEAQAHNSDGF